jgi:DNA segregation ATPase FtsK/SpoIIIE, S-DNA-T family
VAAGAGCARIASEVVHHVAATVEKRLAESDYSGQPLVLVLFGLQRALSLQPADPDASSHDEGPATATDASLVGKILRDGPEVGLHVVAACDSAKTIEQRLSAELAFEFAFGVAGSAATAADLSFTTRTYGARPKCAATSCLSAIS